jgi:hypothetical protein
MLRAAEYLAPSYFGKPTLCSFGAELDSGAADRVTTMHCTRQPGRYVPPIPCSWPCTCRAALEPRRPIAAGEELTIDYGARWVTMALHHAVWG